MAVDFLKEHLEAAERKAAEEAAAGDEEFDDGWSYDFYIHFGHVISLASFLATLYLGFKFLL